MSGFCRHVGVCGGCVFQDMPRDVYLAAKRERIVRALEHHGLDGAQVEYPAEVAPGTRRRATLNACKKDGVTTVGFHALRSHEVVDMEECRVLTPALVALVSPLREVLSTLLRDGESIDLRVTDAENGIDLDLRAGDRANGARWISALAPWAGRHGVIRVTINGDPALQLDAPVVGFGAAQVELPPGAFLQPTVEGERLLQDIVRAAVEGQGRIADLFAGCGTFALVVAERARVHAVDSDPAALAALQAAARRTQKLKPVTTERRNLIRHPLSPREFERFDAVLLDPPRAGALAQCRTLAASRIGRVIYVSCDSQTFGRDARILVEGGFGLGTVRPIDQFLWSSHIELVAQFERR